MAVTLENMEAYILEEYKWMNPVVAGQLAGKGGHSFVTVTILGGFGQTSFCEPELLGCADGDRLKKIVDARMRDVAYGAWLVMGEKLGFDEE